MYVQNEEAAAGGSTLLQIVDRFALDNHNSSAEVETENIGMNVCMYLCMWAVIMGATCVCRCVDRYICACICNLCVTT